MLTSKENELFQFDKNIDLCSLPNKYKVNSIQLDYGQSMFGIRVLNWYPIFFCYLVEYASNNKETKYLHLTRSPGIGKSTFIYYLILRWIALDELFIKYHCYQGLNIEFYDQYRVEKILILHLGNEIYIGSYNKIIKSTYYHIKFSYLYYINNRIATRVENNMSNYYVTITIDQYDQVSVKINIMSQFFLIFNISDGINIISKYSDYQKKSLV
ncbi:hypothetical protein TRFO_07005 [Tritrichomonas foetus]|uniref:Uncharacterized protein n=1 Tax=Tritrichomonas foetus TaxID=1144522 RepID=A0A1J4JYI9_9EUKA|nr:hypothetical protein TRFO_07005 [Tritrichomonas foetus]|eukprot:OHT02596.1 hypothetical protein TRFO_07005 [Tritrichomonas foetus]